jgi:hypothetical protein
MFPRQPSRRKFLGSSVSAGAFLLADTALAKFSFGDRNGVRKQPSLCLFSKPLEKLSYAELADFGAELGIEGIDLTVRTPGHVSRTSGGGPAQSHPVTRSCRAQSADDHDRHRGCER